MVPIDGFATSRSVGSVMAGLDRPPSGLRLRGGLTAGWVRGSSPRMTDEGVVQAALPPPPDGGPRHSSVALMAFSPPLPRGQALKSLHWSDFAFGTARSPASGRGKDRAEIGYSDRPAECAERSGWVRGSSPR